MGQALSEAESLDYRLHHHASALDNMQVGPAMPSDSPADFCLDELAQMRADILAKLGVMLSTAAGPQAVFAYLQWVLRRCTEVGMAEWMKQENDQGSIARGEDAIVLALQLVTQLMRGDGDSHKVMTGRQQAMRAQAILFAIGRTHKTETQIAEEFGYTRANVSAVVKQYQRKLSLCKSRGMKSEDAVEVYRERAKRVHAKRKKQENQWNQQTNSNSHNRLSTLRSALMQTLAPAS
jgi:DNA-binding MarR family transcriptional regulator